MEDQKQVIVLDGKNYFLWARTTKTLLRSCGLWVHCLSSQEMPKGIDEAGSEKGGVKTSAPISSSLGDSKWIQEDQRVVVILQSSLEQSILASYSYVEKAKELWDTLKEVYGNESKIWRIFEIQLALNTLQQGGREVKDHLGEFRRLWGELEMLRPHTLDVKEMIMERREQDQVFGLLLALDKSYVGLIHHILRFEKLPTLSQVCMMIQRRKAPRVFLKGQRKQLIRAR
ncbi:hypothetical protein V5N11_013539 [Cardamine amara subsp. amara]|uniref:Retrotransposon Copia-like N-terminal domain-containing protein n=1 Tax=Cardamine amara subsp. amara TaxID=228776 RepID=A0ABD1BED4_CARAN